MTRARARRRRVTAVVLLLAGVLAVGGAGNLPSPRAYEGPVSDHFDGQHFFNPEGESGTGGAQNSARRRLVEYAQEWRRPHWPTSIPVRQTVPPRRVYGRALRVTWIGHATTLVQGDGLNILFDPVWADRASPFWFAGPRRVRAPGVRLEDLPPVDLILISHDHYDHLDLPTLRYIAARDHPRMVAGLGVDRLLAENGLSATAGDWGRTIPIRPGVAVRIMRAHHWSARWTNDRDRTLWVGFRLTLPGGDIYYSGDTGPGDMGWARAAAQGPRIRLALLPIAPYKVRSAPTGNHIDPDQAAAAFAMIDPGWALGVHWGTFQLGEEPIDGAPRRLRAALLARRIDPARFRTLAPGEAWDVPALPQGKTV